MDFSVKSSAMSPLKKSTPVKSQLCLATRMNDFGHNRSFTSDTSDGSNRSPSHGRLADNSDHRDSGIDTMDVKPILLQNSYEGFPDSYMPGQSESPFTSEDMERRMQYLSFFNSGLAHSTPQQGDWHKYRHRKHSQENQMEGEESESLEQFFEQHRGQNDCPDEKFLPSPIHSNSSDYDTGEELNSRLHDNSDELKDLSNGGNQSKPSGENDHYILFLKPVILQPQYCQKTKPIIVMTSTIKLWQQY